MRFTGLAILALALIGCAAQREATETMKVHEVVKEYPGVSQKDIHARLERWIAQNFRSAKDVIQHSNAEAGSLVAKGNWPSLSEFAPLVSADIHFTLTVDIKEGRARYSLGSIEAYQASNKNSIPHFARSEKCHQDVEVEFQRMVSQISAAIMTKDSNW